MSALPWSWGAESEQTWGRPAHAVPGPSTPGKGEVQPWPSCPDAGALEPRCGDTQCVVRTLSEMLCTACIPAALPNKGVIEPLESMSPFRTVVPALVVIFLLMHCEPDFLRGNI